MRLIAATRPPVAVAYGAYLHAGGTRLRCGVLLVQANNKHKTIILKNPETNERIRVRLPDEVRGKRGHARVDRIELEVMS